MNTNRLLIEIHDQKTWDDFVAGQKWSSFQQSWQWGEFQKTQRHEVKRFIMGESAAQMIFYKRRFSGYWFCPRGPVGEFNPALFSQFSLQPKPLFYRFEPPMEEAKMPSSIRRTHAMSPASTILVDLTKSEDELLAAMHSKTRYNIRVAQKHSVTVEESNDFEAFSRLLTETAERRAWTPHERLYLKAMYEFLSARQMARLRIASLKGRPIAADMEISFGDTVTYLHGGSSSADRNVMAPFLLHWEAIRAAKQEGHRFYDLWGCNPDDRSSPYYKPSWEGITRFKEGWGGQKMHLIGTWDLPTNNLFYSLIFWRALIK